MIVVAEGEINVTLEGKSYRVKRNQTLIIPPLSYHAVTANEEGSYRWVTVLFDISAIPDVLRPEFGNKGTDVGILFSPCVEKLRDICQKEEPSFYAPLVQRENEGFPKAVYPAKRLALASKLIGEGTPPTAAARQVSYENYSNFYRIYLKHFGTSPTKKKE